MNKHIITSLVIVNINNLYCAEKMTYEVNCLGLKIDEVYYGNVSKVQLDKDKIIKIEDLKDIEFAKLKKNTFGDANNLDLDTKIKLNDISSKQIKNLHYYKGSDFVLKEDCKIDDKCNYIIFFIGERTVNSNLKIKIYDLIKYNDKMSFSLQGSKYDKKDIKTSNQDEFLKSLQTAFGDIKDKDEKKLNSITDIEKDYLWDFTKLFGTYDANYVRNNKLSENELKDILERFDNSDDSSKVTIKLYKLNDYQIKDITLDDSFKLKKLKDKEELKGKINNLLKKQFEKISLDKIQEIIAKSSEKTFKDIKIKEGDEELELNDDIIIEITNIDDSFLEDKKVTIKFGIDESKKDKLKISDGKKDIIITFNSTINENTEIVNYITNVLKLDKIKYKVVKGESPITNNEKFVDSETYTILFTDKVEDYVEELKEDDIQISIEFTVNDSTKLKLNESNKTCDIILKEKNCGITEFLNKLNSRYNGINNGVILSIKEDGNNTELLNNNTYKCEKNKKYIITLGKKINNLVEEIIEKTPNKDDEKDDEKEKEKEKESDEQEINKNNTDLENNNKTEEKGVKYCEKNSKKSEENKSKYCKKR